MLVKLVPPLPLPVPHTSPFSFQTLPQAHLQKGIVNSFKWTMRTQEYNTMSGLTAITTIHYGTWHCLLTLASNIQSRALPHLQVLFVCAWCPLFFCTKEMYLSPSLELTSTHLLSNKHANDFKNLIMFPHMSTLGQNILHPDRICFNELTPI